MLEGLKETFGMFGLQPVYNLDKKRLKQQYYALSKTLHPDARPQGGDASGSTRLNKAYKTLMDDYSRARLFTTPNPVLDTGFLAHCLELEERIRAGDDVRKELDARIAECSRRHSDPEWLARWAYYRRLRDMAPHT